MPSLSLVHRMLKPTKIRYSLDESAGEKLIFHHAAPQIFFKFTNNFIEHIHNAIYYKIQIQDVNTNT